MLIYKIVNLINGKCYIGQTTKDTYNSRWNCHRRSKNNSILSKAIRKYGESNFQIYTIDYAKDQEELDNKEIFWIKFYKSMYNENGYNIKSGGSNGVLPKETIDKIGNTLKKKFQDPDFKEKAIRHLKNPSEETRKKMSESKKNKKLPDSQKEKISKALKGRKFSEEHGKKIAASKKGMKYNWKNKKSWHDFSEETRKLIIEKKTKWKCKKEMRKFHIQKRKQKRINLMLEFKKNGTLSYIVCNETNEIFHKHTDAKKKYNLKSSVLDHLIGLYSHCGGYTFTAYFTSGNEGVTDVN